jgi:hypothetical protein
MLHYLASATYIRPLLCLAIILSIQRELLCFRNGLTSKWTAGSSFREPFSSRSTVADIESEVEGQTKVNGFVPVVNTSSMDISLTNPFGPAVFSVTDCKEELLKLLKRELEMEDSFRHCRLEYLTKYMENSYVPAQTIPFLQFIINGEWQLYYSNVMTPRADNTLYVLYAKYRVS